MASKRSIAFFQEHGKVPMATSAGQRGVEAYGRTVQKGYLTRANQDRKSSQSIQDGQGVVELQDGHRLCLYGNVLYALSNHSSALVTDVCIKYLGWKTVSEAIPKIASLTRLKKLVFEVGSQTVDKWCCGVEENISYYPIDLLPAAGLRCEMNGMLVWNDGSRLLNPCSLR